MSNTIGQNIKRIRKQQGLKQRELADKLNIKQVQVSQWENGTRKPKYETLIKIASALNLSSVDDLMDKTDKLLMYEIAMSQKTTENDNVLIIGSILVSEENLLKYYNLLNHAGKKAAIEEVRRLQFVPEYTEKEDTPFD